MATRRWWRRRDGGDDEADDLVPMDTQEQEELVRSLEQKQAQQSRRWRRVFAGFVLAYAAFLVYSSFHHAWSPWELRYHAYFMEDLPAPMVIIADWIAALACLFAVKGLLQNSGPSKKWMWYSCYIGILVAIFWTYYILRLPRIRWDVAWLPLGPLIAGVLSLYVDHVLIESMQDITTLRRTRSREIATETAHPYRLSELQVATNNFASRIGSGGFGIVYYGKLSDGKEIAVKVPSNDSYQGKKQFSNEVSLLSRIHHRNLVAFLGYCHEDGRNILVYEFMHNGTLKEHLHGRDKHISWIKRLEIAEDAAKGIEYLHTGCTPSIIHRDIKTSNILLDKQMRAKVSDFGLSKFAAEESHASTNVRGTLGYLDPQYYISQQLTEKSDMYSFGIILLELISGRPPISTFSFGDHFRNIGPWAKFYYEGGDIEAIVDPSISGAGGYQDVQSVWKIAEAAVRCIDSEPRKRPCMPEVVKEIQDAMALERTWSSSEAGRCGGPFSPAAASVRSGGTMRSHDMVMDNLLLMDDEDDSSLSGSVSKLKYPELR